MQFKIWLESINRKFYHGTSGDFDSFRLDRAGERDYGDFGLGVYMTPNSSLAISYAGQAAKRKGGDPVVLVVQHSLQNPANFDDPQFEQQIAQALEIPFPKKLNSGLKQTRPKEEAVAITKYITSLGYDSATARGGNELVAYDPSKLQIIEKIPIEAARSRMLL